MSSFDELMVAYKRDFGDNIGGAGFDFGDLERIPTGWFPFDLASAGGIVKGRYTELFGNPSSCKSNCAYRAIAMHQLLWPKQKCAWIDLENTHDPRWSSKLGVNNDALYVIRPDYGEATVDIIEGLMGSPECGLIVVDSLPMLIPINEVEGSAERTQVGGNSLLVGKLMRKIVNSFTKAGKQGYNPTVIGINQIRHKIGGYGNPECLHGDTPIHFADGSSHPIKDVVENRIDKPIWSFDESSGEYKISRIKEYYNNGKAKDGEFLTIKAQGVETKNGIFSATTSITHKFLTDSGWKEAQDLVAGEDRLLTKYVNRITGDLHDFMAGSFCGDTTLRVKKNKSASDGKGTTVGLRVRDSKNNAYAKWKAEVYSQYWDVVQKQDGRGFTYWDVKNSTDIRQFSDNYNNNRDPSYFFDNFTWLGFAVWIMDDGCFNRDRYSLSIGRFKNNLEMKEKISKHLIELGLDHTWVNKNVVFNTSSSGYIAEKIARYVPECMEYKLPEKLRKQRVVVVSNSGNEVKEIYTELLSVCPASGRKYRHRDFYDIEIEKYANYMAGNVDNGFVVHNTTAGGNTKQFAQSMRIRFWGKDKKDTKYHKDLPVAKDVSFIIQKHKFPILCSEGQMDIAMLPHKGLKVGECDDFGLVKQYMEKHGVLEKQGAKWVFMEEEYPNLKSIRKLLRDDVKLANSVKQAIIATEIENANRDEEDDDSGDEEQEEKPKKKKKK